MLPTKMIEGHNPIDDTIHLLMRVARPDGEVYQRLEKYKDKLERNVFLGEKAMRFIADLVDKYNAAIAASKQEQK